MINFINTYIVKVGGDVNIELGCMSKTIKSYVLSAALQKWVLKSL